MLDPQVSPEEVKSREVELGSERSMVEPSLFLPLLPLSPSLISHVASVEVKQNVYLLTSSKHCIYTHAR